MKQKIKKGVGLGFLISIIQIFLIINAVIASSYIIGQFDFSRNSLEANNNLESFIPEISGFLISLLSIKQIKTVSAQIGDVSFNCCVQTNNKAICQDISSEIGSSGDSNSCENPLPTRCAETEQCKIGTCIYKEGLSCAANSPKQECENKGGTWKQGTTYEIRECIKGACILGGDIKYSTEKQCELLSESAGLEMDFRPGVSEFEFRTISENIQKGACVLPGENCRFVTISECGAMNGNFFENKLCSNPNLATNCEPSEKTTCVGDKVYFVDTCGNPANIYDASKVNSNQNIDYWSVVSNQSCTLDLDNPSSVESCGNCNIFLSSQCSDASSGEVSYGDHVCRNLRCIDENGNTKLNGEKWCIYDGFIGDGKDTVGSEHWLAYCNNGKTELDMCSGYRGQVCEQRIIEESGFSFSTASCVVNQAFKCLDQSLNCIENAHCTIKNIDVDKGFKFSMCVPEYPRGFDAKNTLDSKVICSMADSECKVIYKKTRSGWKCIFNCNCERIAFTEQMNDLCISLGDCGSYVNYIGDGTDNIQVENAPSISWTRYKSFANVVKGKYIDAAKRSNLVSPIGTSIGLDSYQPEEVNSILAKIGGAGVSYGVELARAYFEGVVIEVPLSPIPGELTTLFGPEAVSAQISSDISSITNGFGDSILGNFGAATIGSFIGGFVGKFIANALGIEGPAATILSIATSVIGSVIAQGLSSGFSNLSAFATGSLIAAAIVVAIIIISGWGKTKIVIVKFSCLPWQPPSGGDKCGKCNDDPSKPCTTYRCESLGKACQLINENTNNPICQSHVQEAIPPVISPSEIRTQGYEFQNQGTRKIEIRKENGECIQEFTPVLFTLKTNELAQCKWSLQPTANYDTMTSFSGEGTDYSLEHNFGIEGVSLSILEDNEISGNIINGLMGNLNIYVRCQDIFGNFNLNEYVVNFCINSAPDITPVNHLLTVTSPLNGSTLTHNTKETNLIMWVNEPAECKYDSIEGKNYNAMRNSFDCRTNLSDREVFGWPCSANLENLQNQNNFYIKCKDQPWLVENESKRNTNTEDFVYTLRKSEDKLNIDSLYIIYNGLRTDLSDASTKIKGGGTSFSIELGVETSKGANNGIALCSYQSNNDFIPFIDSNSNVHKQKFFLLNGDYNFPIKCVDSAGNEATGNAKFNLNIDNSPPKAIRIYYESGKLSLITDEQAKCYVSFDEIKQCGFNTNNADAITSVFSTKHSIDWNTDKTYYIKCEDLFDNKNPSCAIKVSPSFI